MAARTKSKGKTYKFATLREEARKRSEAEGRKPPAEPAPFVIDDVSPPIVITMPDTLERQLALAELIHPDGSFSASEALPMLRALCGSAFGRVWSLIKDDKDPNTAIALVQALMQHMYEQAGVEEAEELPGGSVGSSN
jgi:hypothetical protein